MFVVQAEVSLASSRGQWFDCFFLFLRKEEQLTSFPAEGTQPGKGCWLKERKNQNEDQTRILSCILTQTRSWTGTATWDTIAIYAAAV